MPAAVALVAVVAAVIAVLAAVLLWLRGRLFVVTVEGRSMEPFLRAGQRALARRAPRGGVRAGQVIVITRPELGSEAEIVGWEPGRWMVKRVAAVSGDPVPAALADATGGPGAAAARELDGTHGAGRTGEADGADGADEAREAGRTGGADGAGGAHGARAVPPGRILVLGDNPEVSLDSRTFGAVPVERVLGVVIHRMRAPA
ncbi:signal peptidase I [Planobispora longispora]|uniref:Signal peptidase I n=1 Tax=Planobispora longispora TaxID=28887 RepID=A0A8J3W3M6_9ACTN|nr:signal peptidase I [Planobispora longispora]GIH73966.1 hypothetical protein Plo01_03950 [Planobispora longispora]